MTDFDDMSREELLHALTTLLGERRDDSTLSRKMLETIIKQVPVGIMVAMPPDCQIVIANDEAVRLLGVNRERQLRISLNDTTHVTWKLFNAHRERIPIREQPLPKAVLDGARFQDQEYLIQRADNSESWIMLSAGPFRDESGEITGGVVTFADITERKAMISTLLKSEEKFRGIYENIIDGYYRADMYGVLTLASPSTARILGYDSTEKLIGRNIAQNFYADPKQREGLVKKLSEEHSVHAYHVTLLRADGGVVEIETSSRLIFDENNTPIGVEGIFRDVTDRIKAEQQLRQSNTYYRRLFESTGAATVIFDSDGIILKSNTKFQELSGFSEAEINGKLAWPSFVSPDDRERMLTYHQQRESEGNEAPREYDFTFIDRHGQHTFVHVVVDVIEETQERIASLINISPRKEAEEQLAQLNQQLEILVQQRTIDLERKAAELETANIRLKELDALKSHLLSSVSHELRTPLTSILGFAKITGKTFSTHFSSLCAEDPQLSAKAQMIAGNLDIISEEGERLRRLINESLDLSKIESGSFHWRDTPVDLVEIIHTVSKAAAGQFAGKPDVEFRVSIPVKLPYIIADPDKMHQVLLNLINNAAKFTHEGYVELTAEAIGDEVVVKVTDTGEGISEEQLPLVFEKFFTVHKDDTMSGAMVGAGLGLALCREVVEHYHGAISVSSTLNEGSVFTITMPAKELE